MFALNYRLVALDLVNLIAQLAESDFNPNPTTITPQLPIGINFPINDPELLQLHPEIEPVLSIWSPSQKYIYITIMGLSAVQNPEKERDRALIKFCWDLAGAMPVSETARTYINKILAVRGVKLSNSPDLGIQEFELRNYHPEIYSQTIHDFRDGEYNEVVREACMVYESSVQKKSNSLDKSGVDLMNFTLNTSPKSSLIYVPPFTISPDTQKSINQGIQFLSAGIMSAYRNPPSHELGWTVSKQDCLDVLSLISLLMKQLDNFVPRQSQNSP